MKIKIDVNLKVGKLVKFFILTDFTLVGGWGLLAPVFSIFIIQQINGASLETVGIAAAIYWLIKSVFQIPFANFLDKTDGERDDFYSLIGSLTLAGVTAFAFLFVKEVWQLYIVESLHAIALGMYVPSWSSVFSRHLDRDRYSFDWSLDSSMVGIASGVSGFLGAFLAQRFGYNVIFVAVGIMSLLGIFFVMAVPEFRFPSPAARKPFIGDHKPPNIG